MNCKWILALAVVLLLIHREHAMNVSISCISTTAEENEFFECRAFTKFIGESINLVLEDGRGHIIGNTTVNKSKTSIDRWLGAIRSAIWIWSKFCVRNRPRCRSTPVSGSGNLHKRAQTELFIDEYRAAWRWQSDCHRILFDFARTSLYWRKWSRFS